MKVVALKANKNKDRKFSNSTTVYNGLYFVPVWASTSTNPMSLQVTVLTRLLVHCQIAPRQTTLDLNTRKILLKFCSLDIKITTNRLSEQKGSVISGLGNNISLPHCLATGIWNLAHTTNQRAKISGNIVRKHTLAKNCRKNSTYSTNEIILKIGHIAKAIARIYNVFSSSLFHRTTQIGRASCRERV